MEQKLCNRNIRILNFFTICINAVMLLPIILPFYQDVLGMTFHEFLIVESVFCGMIVALDVPTGWMADRWGRKPTMILGGMAFGSGIFMLTQAAGFWSAVLAESIIGTGSALMNGANSAMLYDSLLCAGRENEFRKREGFRFALQLYSCAAASIAGGYLYTISPVLPMVAHDGLIVLAVISAFFFIEPPRHKKTAVTHPLKDILRTIRYIAHGHKEIGGLILLMMLVFATTKICMFSIQAYTGALGWPESWNGWIISVVMLLGGISGHIGHKLFPSLYGRKALYTVGLLLVVCLIGAGIGLTWFGLVCLSMEAFAFGFGMPRAQEAINNLADSSIRATVLSTASLSTALGFIPMSQLIGWMTDEYGIGTGLLSHAVLIMGLGVIAYAMIERYHKRVSSISIVTGT